MVSLNEAKITRAEKRFYPEWAVKVRGRRNAIKA